MASRFCMALLLTALSSAPVAAQPPAAFSGRAITDDLDASRPLPLDDSGTRVAITDRLRRDMQRTNVGWIGLLALPGLGRMAPPLGSASPPQRPHVQQHEGAVVPP